jgi:hypothetical protein
LRLNGQKCGLASPRLVGSAPKSIRPSSLSTTGSPSIGALSTQTDYVPFSAIPENRERAINQYDTLRVRSKQSHGKADSILQGIDGSL